MLIKPSYIQICKVRFSLGEAHRKKKPALNALLERCRVKSSAFHIELPVRPPYRSRTGSPLLRSYINSYSSGATLLPLLSTTTRRLSALTLSFERQSGGTSSGVISWWDKARHCLQQLITPSEIKQKRKPGRVIIIRRKKNKQISVPEKEQSCVSLNLDYVTSVDVCGIH